MVVFISGRTKNGTGVGKLDWSKAYTVGIRKTDVRQRGTLPQKCPCIAVIVRHYEDITCFIDVDCLTPLSV